MCFAKVYLFNKNIHISVFLGCYSDLTSWCESCSFMKWTQRKSFCWQEKDASNSDKAQIQRPSRTLEQTQFCQDLEFPKILVLISKTLRVLSSPTTCSTTLTRDKAEDGTSGTNLQSWKRRQACIHKWRWWHWLLGGRVQGGGRQIRRG